MTNSYLPFPMFRENLPKPLIDYCRKHHDQNAGSFDARRFTTFLHDKPIRAAVLIPILYENPEICVLFTQRSPELPEHAHQISFPGGKEDHSDTDLTITALRENEEELGVPREKIAVLGELPFHHTFSGFEIKPIVGWIPILTELKPNIREVSSIFTVPLSFLLDSNNYQERSRLVAGEIRDYLAIPYQNWIIWGATAAMSWTLRHQLLEEVKNHG